MSEDLFSLGSFPSKIVARAIAPGQCKRMFGYDVEGDLSRLPFSAVLYLGIVGELPNRRELRAFEVALWLGSAVSIEEGACHAAVLARLCGSNSAAIHGTAAMGLAQRASILVTEADRALEQLDWSHLDEGAVTSHGEHCRTALGIHASFYLAWRTSLGVDAMMIALLRETGLRDREQLERAVVLATLPSVLAEAFSAKSGTFQNYAVNVPPLEYSEIDD